MFPAYAAIVLRLPTVVPEPIDYYWADVNGNAAVYEAQSSFAVGLGGEFGFASLASGSPIVSVDLDLRHESFVSDYPMAFQMITLPVDIGWRFDTESFGAEGPVSFWFGFGLGPRFTYFVVPDWSDQLAIAGGVDTSLGLTFGTGKLRGNLGASIGIDFSGGGAYGYITLPDAYVNWSTTSGGVVASVQAGVELR